MSSEILKLPVALLCVCSLLAGASVAWNLGRAPLLVELSQQAETHASEKQRAAEQATATLQAAQDRGDALSVGLLNQQTHIDQLKTEARRAIPQVTSGRPCLGLPALRVLNSAPGLAVAGLPPAASGAAAAGGRVATDTDLAGWTVDAGAYYAICRARLGTLIDFYPPAPEGQ